MIKVTNLKIEYAEVIFKNLSFKLGNREKVGLVGLNGCGKSTLLKILTAEEKADDGSIELLNEKIGYLPQEFELDAELMVGEYLESLVENHITDMWKIDVILSKLGLQIVNDGRVESKNSSLIEIDFFAKVSTLSEGQKMKLYLTKLLSEESTILLLDEPTNHLDIEGIEWFESFVKKFDGIVIVISHDRSFLNNTVNQIFEIDEKKLNIFHGNYDDYIVQKEQWIEKRASEYRLQERRRKKFEERIALIRKFGNGKKVKSMLSNAKKRMEREVLSKEVDQYSDSTLDKVSIGGNIHGSKTVLKAESVSFGYDKSKRVIEDSSLKIYGKEKVWFLGANGIGKTTFVKTIIGELKPDEGETNIGLNTKWAYFSQDQSHLDPEESVRKYLMRRGNINIDRSYGVLEKFLFPKKIQDFKIKQLSPGQRARLSIAAFAQHDYEFLILDEPTNHLDIRTKEVIEDALREFKGSIFLISHDRYFVESVGVDRVVTIEDKRITEV